VVTLVLGLTLTGAAVAWTGVHLIIGLLVTAFGIGLIAAAAVAYVLSARWGLLDMDRRDRPRS
jgi:hypothetical protein